MSRPRAVTIEGTYRSGSPLVPAVVDGDTVYVSGVVPVDMDTGTVAENEITAQTRQVLANLERVLAAAGSRLDHVVKTTVFITEQSEFQAMNKTYAEVFGAWLPARTTIVTTLARPQFRVEIEAVAKVVGAGA